MYQAKKTGAQNTVKEIKQYQEKWLQHVQRMDTNRLPKQQQSLEAAQMKFLRHLLGITKLDKEKNQCIRQKTGAQNIVKETKRYQEKWLQHVQRMDTNRLPKQALQYKPKEEETQDDRGRDGGTNFILRIKEQDNMPNPSGT